MDRMIWGLCFCIVTISCGGSKQVPAEVRVRNSELHGRVESSGGEGQPGLSVQMLAGGNPVGDPAVTTGYGEFILRNVPVGVFEIRIAGRGNFEPMTETIRHDFRTQFRFNMPPIILQDRHTRFIGRVVFREGQGSEKPVVGAVVRLIGPDNEVRTDREGNFHLTSSWEFLEGVQYALTVFAGDQFEPETKELPRIVKQSDNPVGTIALKARPGVTNIDTLISPSYIPPGSKGPGRTTIN